MNDTQRRLHEAAMRYGKARHAYDSLPDEWTRELNQAYANIGKASQQLTYAAQEYYDAQTEETG